MSLFFFFGVFALVCKITAGECLTLRKVMNGICPSVRSSLLDYKTHGLEVSYNSCGVFGHMMSDGAQAWTVEEPSRDVVLQRMMSEINDWPLDSKRNINYR